MKNSKHIQNLRTIHTSALKDFYFGISLFTGNDACSVAFSCARVG